jgi:glutamyl-tRNA synthetase
MRVRFAPSPTGYLHIGGARTCLYDYFLAKASGGQLVLRIEDTDLERSKKEYEVSQINDLKWLGIEFDEGPGFGGDYGPYRQSERLDIYREYVQKLLDSGRAYYDFCTDEELEQMKEQAIKEGKPPFYYGKWSDPKFYQGAKERVAKGEKAAIRFKVEQKEYILKDVVRGDVKFPPEMVGDFVIMRSNGLPVYNFCCVVDDVLMKITHVLRGEDHLNNTLRQLMLYEALEAELPVFLHVSLLIGEDRQKLSKRHGATSLTYYRENSYLPQAMVNYLCMLGWSHPEEKDIFDGQELAKVFDQKRFSKAPAVYDTEKLKWVNGQHFRSLDNETILSQIDIIFPRDHFFFQKDKDWQLKAVQLFKDQVDLLADMPKLLEKFISEESIDRTEKLQEVLTWETTPQIHQFLLEKFNTSDDKEYFSSEDIADFINTAKKDLKIKGKNLFLGFRVLLTGKDYGPDLKQLAALIPKNTIHLRLKEFFHG